MIARFSHYQDKEFVQSFYKNLNGANIGFSDDFPKEVEDIHKALYPVFKEVRRNQQRAYFNFDKLIIDGRIFRGKENCSVALWRLATGDTYRLTSLQFSIGRMTALKAKKEFCKILAKEAGEFIKFPITEAEATVKICSFTNNSSFPQVVGAIDGTHILLKSVPQRERVEYFNRKQGYSIVLQGVAGVVDALFPSLH